MFNLTQNLRKAATGIFAVSIAVSTLFIIPRKLSCDSETTSSVAGLDSYNSDMEVDLANLFDNSMSSTYEYKASNKIAYINSNAVIVRKEPSDESETIFTLDYASKVFIMGEDISQSDGWTKVYYDNMSGFVRTEYISYDVLFIPEQRYIYISGQTELRSSPNKEMDNVIQMLEQNNRFVQTGYNEDWIQIAANGVYYYLDANFSSSNMIFYEEEKNVYLKKDCYLKVKPIASEKYNGVYLEKDTKLLQVEYNDTWLKLVYNNKYYYIEKTFTTPYLVSYSPNSYTISFDDTVYSGDIAVVLETAYDFLGTSYVYGQATRYATDCSGLTMQCYAEVGISLPHKAAGQAYYGRDVMNEELRPGDLIMFSSRYSSYISHVGIYVGDGMMIHAADSRRGVIASDLQRYCENGGQIQAVRRMIE